MVLLPDGQASRPVATTYDDSTSTSNTAVYDRKQNTNAAGTTQNGGPIDGPLANWTIPGTTHTVQLTAYPPAALCLLYFLGRWQAEIENIGQDDTGGYDKRPIGGLNGDTSNHRSGTAVDMDYATKHPAWTNTTSPANQAKARTFLAALQGTVRWGFDWGDDQHVELAPGYLGTCVAIARQINAGQLPNTPNSLLGAGLQAVGDTGSVPGAVSSSGVSPTTGLPAKVLPPIQRLPNIATTTITHAETVNRLNQLGRILVQGKKLRLDVAARTVSAQMSYSVGQVGQLTLIIQDYPDLRIFRSNLFQANTQVDFVDQHMEVRSLDITPTDGAPQLTVKCRSRAVGRLRSKAQSGSGSWGSITPNRWAADRASEVGAFVIAQPFPAQTITRQESDTLEYTWDVFQRLASTIGAWCFEYDQVIVLARPSWLILRPGTQGWSIAWAAQDDYSDNLLGAPQYSVTADGDAAETLTFTLLGDDAYRARPGDYVPFDGGDGALWTGKWIVTAVTIDATLAHNVQVVASRVVDPVAVKSA